MDKKVFTKEMKDEGYQIAIPNMSPVHFNIMKRIFINHGYKPVLSRFCLRTAHQP